jgi:hypothetical protein
MEIECALPIEHPCRSGALKSRCDAAARAPFQADFRRLLKVLPGLGAAPPLTDLSPPGMLFVASWPLGYALAHERVILPVLAGGTKRTAVPMDIINRQWTDIREEFERGMVRLIQAVTARRSGEIPQFS